MQANHIEKGRVRKSTKMYATFNIFQANNFTDLSNFTIMIFKIVDQSRAYVWYMMSICVQNIMNRVSFALHLH